MRFDSNNIDDYNKYNDYNSSRPPSGKSKGSVLAIIILVFAAMFVYMAFGIHHMIKKNIEEKMGDLTLITRRGGVMRKGMGRKWVIKIFISGKS